MNRLSCLSFVLVLLASNPAVAETKSGDDSEQNFETPGVESSLVSNILHLDEANTALNPFQKLAKSWPEDLVIAPIPAYSPQLGWNLTLGGAYFLDIGEKDADVSPSLVGGFAMAAENGSYAYGAGTYLHLLNDKLRVKAGAAHIDIRYRFYGIGNEIDFLNIDVLQEGPAYFLTGSWNVWKKLYVGLGYRRGSVDTRLRFDVDDSSFFDPVLNIELGAISIPIEIDSRDHEQFPRNGWQILGQTVLYRESVGSDFEAETYKLSINRYFPMRETDVLAARLVVRSAGEDVPFFLLSTFGGTTDLRGYPSGRYRDRQMYSVQTEYRWQFSDRWIFTGFAGVGEVAEHFSEMGRNFLPAGGVGARFVLSEKHKIGLSFDVATGKDGTEVYFGVGEAF
jgi:hypothetical protein